MFENKKDESMSDARERILKDINEIWYANTKEFNVINKENIIKSFKIAGISNELEGSEDHIFDGYDIINKLITNKKQKQILNLIQPMILMEKMRKKIAITFKFK